MSEHHDEFEEQEEYQHDDSEFEEAAATHLRIVPAAGDLQYENVEEALAAMVRECGNDVVRRARFLSKHFADFHKYVELKFIKGKGKNAEYTCVAEPDEYNIGSALLLLCGMDTSHRVLHQAAVTGFAPYTDTFSANRFIPLVNDRVVNEKFIPGGNIPAALRAMHFKTPSTKGIQNQVLAIADANLVNTKERDLIAALPVWDGVKRATADSDFSLKMLRCAVGDDQRDQWMRTALAYFWHSIYNRIMHPGCEAPMSLVLIGPQNCGKSTFSKRINTFVLDPLKTDHTTYADPATWNFEKSTKDNMQSMHGQTFVIGFPELAGYSASDIAHVKNILTATSDTYDRKFAASNKFDRMTIFIGDSNKAKGITRDDTGERRLLTVYCCADGQEPPDEYTTPVKRDEDKINLLTRNDFLQIMAEIHEFYEKQTNWSWAYKAIINAANEAVTSYMSHEISTGRTTNNGVKDQIDWRDVLRACKIQRVIRERSTANGDAGSEFFVAAKKDLIKAMQKCMEKGQRPSALGRALDIEFGKYQIMNTKCKTTTVMIYQIELSKYFDDDDEFMKGIAATGKQLLNAKVVKLDVGHVVNDPSKSW